MYRNDTFEKVEEIIESFENCYLTEVICILTPRDIKEAILDRQNKYTDNDKMEELLHKWHKEFKKTDDNLTKNERLELLRKTLIIAEKDMKDSDYTTKYSKCDMKEFIESMDILFQNLYSLSDNQKVRLLNILKKENYNIVANWGHYPYLCFFIMEVIAFERYVYCEIIPHKKEIVHFSRVLSLSSDETFNDEIMKRLTFYRGIGERNRHRYLATLKADTWAINFDTFAKLYRKIFAETNKAITSPYYLK